MRPLVIDVPLSTPEQDQFVQRFSIEGEYGPSAMLLVTNKDREQFFVGKEQRAPEKTYGKPYRPLYGFPQTSAGLEGVISNTESFEDVSTANRLLSCALGQEQEGVLYARPMHKALLADYLTPPVNYTCGKLLLPILVVVDSFADIRTEKFRSKGVEKLGALAARFNRLNNENNPSNYERNHNDRQLQLIGIALQYVGRTSL